MRWGLHPFCVGGVGFSGWLLGGLHLFCVGGVGFSSWLLGLLIVGLRIALAIVVRLQAVKQDGLLRIRGEKVAILGVNLFAALHQSWVIKGFF